MRARPAHFAGVFQVARRAGWMPEGGRLEHVPFGLVQGDDGKKLKTRSGDTVRLKDLLEEAVERAEADLRRRLAEEERQEEEAFITHVATTVGLAAVKYADLSTEPHHQLPVQLRSHAGPAAATRPPICSMPWCGSPASPAGGAWVPVKGMRLGFSLIPLCSANLRNGPWRVSCWRWIR
jgi:hypothetical protein